ncbi:hypothetical protein ATANTOWER_006804 [Ataeniobius toweri]|uniref:Uncharacterized protein n=1 Tax=Ataeniobius toweri TaxID=208326 RepID=A0ABU7B7T3_9TELE|nr:hypothetical protein [Ataeniobius toweri]
MRRPPAPSCARLSTEAGGGFPAHGLATDQPSPLLLTPNPVPVPVSEGFMDEPPPHPDPVSGPVPEGFLDEPPPHPNPVSGPVPEGFLDEPPPHPDPVPGSVLEGSQASHPHTLFLSVRGFWMDCLHSLLLFPVLSWRAPRTNCLHPWFPFRRSSWRTCLHFLFLSLRGVRTHPLHLLCLGGSAADLHGLAEGPSGLRTSPLSSTVGSPGPAAGRQIIGFYVAAMLIACPYVAGLLIACPYIAGLLITRLAEDGPLIAGSAGDSHRSVRLNSGSAGDGLRASRLNSGSAGDGLPAGRLNSGSVGDGLRAYKKPLHCRPDLPQLRSERVHDKKEHKDPSHPSHGNHLDDP